MLPRRALNTDQNPAQSLCIYLLTRPLSSPAQPVTRISQPATRNTYNPSFHHQLCHRLLQAVEGQLKHGKDLADDPYGAGVVPHGSRHGI